MFDVSLVAGLDRSVTGLLKAPAELATPAQTRAALRAIQAAQDELDAVKATHLANLETTGGFEEDEASSLSMWVRRELRLPAGEARALVAAANTVKVLPLVWPVGGGRTDPTGSCQGVHFRASAHQRQTG